MAKTNMISYNILQIIFGNNIFNLERENAELGRNVTNLINKKNVNIEVLN